jgi:hypothetical protein
MMKKYFFILLFAFFIISCKKNKDINFDNTTWNTKFRYEGFDFFAEKKLQLLSDKSCLDIGISDTSLGTWSATSSEIKIKLEDNTEIVAKIINQDSLNGYRTNNSYIAQWLAKKQ